MALTLPTVTTGGASLWARYEADAGLSLSDDDPVSTWSDQSGNGMTLTGVTTTRPTFKSTGWGNGLPCVRFGGTASNRKLTAAAVADWKFLNDGSHWTVFVVWKTKNDDNGTDAVQALIDTGGSASLSRGFLIQYNNTLGSFTYAGRNIVSRTVSGANALSLTVSNFQQAMFPHCIGFSWNGTTQTCYEWGISQGTGSLLNAFSNANPSFPLTVGINAVTGNTHAVLGDIAAILIFKGALNATDVGSFNAYLEAKWHRASLVTEETWLGTEGIRTLSGATQGATFTKDGGNPLFDPNPASTPNVWDAYKNYFQLLKIDENDYRLWYGAGYNAYFLASGPAYATTDDLETFDRPNLGQVQLEPALVSSSARSNFSTGTSVTPALPTSRENGCLLIALVGTKDNQTHNISGTGWVKYNQWHGGGSWTLSLHYRYVDGSEGTPTISWTSNVAGFSQIHQYKGTHASAPFGNVLANGASSSTHTNTGITTSAHNSLVVLYDAFTNNTAVTITAGWMQDIQNGNSTGLSRNLAGYKFFPTSGTATGTTTINAAPGSYVMVQLELLTPAGYLEDNNNLFHHKNDFFSSMLYDPDGATNQSYLMLLESWNEDTLGAGLKVLGSDDAVTFTLVKEIHNTLTFDITYKEGKCIVKDSSGKYRAFYSRDHPSDLRSIGFFLSSTTDPTGTWVDQGFCGGLRASVATSQFYEIKIFVFSVNFWVGAVTRFNSTTNKTWIDLYGSRDEGATWTRSQATWIANGGGGTWDEGTIFSGNIVDNGSEYRVFYAGSASLHGSTATNRQIGFGTAELNRLAHITGTGTVLTRALYHPNKVLRINGEGGTITVACLDSSGTAIAGYDDAQSVVLSSEDSLSKIIRWGNSDLPDQPLRLRFTLTSATLYGWTLTTIYKDFLRSDLFSLGGFPNG